MAGIPSAPDAPLSSAEPLESIIVKCWGRESLMLEWGLLSPASLAGGLGWLESPALGTVPAAKDVERAETVCGVLQ